jgi:hypothetical protein
MRGLTSTHIYSTSLSSAVCCFELICTRIIFYKKKRTTPVFIVSNLNRTGSPMGSVIFPRGATSDVASFLEGFAPGAIKIFALRRVAVCGNCAVKLVVCASMRPAAAVTTPGDGEENEQVTSGSSGSSLMQILLFYNASGSQPRRRTGQSRDDGGWTPRSRDAIVASKCWCQSLVQPGAGRSVGRWVGHPAADPSMNLDRVRS